MGRKPLNETLKKHRGTFRSTRKRGEEPRFMGPFPAKPEFLGEVAGAEWDRVVPLLEAEGILRATDFAALLTYVLMFERLLDMQQTGEPITGAFATSFRGAMSCLGLTPADRGRVVADRHHKENPFDEI